MLTQAINALYIEDYQPDFDLLQRTLTKATLCKVSLNHAKTLSEAVGLISQGNHHYDVILLDLHLPDAQGLGMIRKVRAIAFQIPIIVVTGFADEELALKAAQKGAQDCLIKGSHFMPPFDEKYRIEGANHLARLLIYSIERVQLSLQLSEMEDCYMQEHELAHITLQAIGEAVITTDAEGFVISLNPAAESLTGWSEYEARGHSIAKVCQIIDSDNRIPIENPALTVLKQDRQISLPHQLELIARNGKEISISESAAPIHSAKGEIVGAVLVFHDVTEERSRAERLQWQAFHDPLTGIFNRQGFMSLVKQQLAALSLHQTSHYLCYCDLDNFKIVNDTCGHSAGDELLKQIVRLISSKIRTADSVARVGGDEFALFLNSCSKENAVKITEEICRSIGQYRFIWGESCFKIGISIGLIQVDIPHTELDSLMQRADSACYMAKHQGRGQVYIYQNPKDDAIYQHATQNQWFNRLTKALDEELFELYIQPIIPFNTAGNPEMCEVLVRMKDEQGKLVTPSAFMSCAERYDLVIKLDLHVIKKAFYYLSQQMSRKQVIYCINLSGKSINSSSFIESLPALFQEYQINPQQICFEITETAAIRNLSKASQLLLRLKSIGCYLALDDFGSGMSSLAYLRQLPVDFLKIDGAFINDICNDPATLTLVEMINKLGHALQLKTIAEHVSTPQILEQVESLGIDYIQGHLISPPHPWLEHHLEEVCCKRLQRYKSSGEATLVYATTSNI